MKIRLGKLSKIVFSLSIVGFTSFTTVAQTCTITGTSPLNWVNPGPACSEGGNAGSKSIIIVPAGFTLNLDSNGDTWTGTRIEIYGTVNVTANPTFNCNFVVRNGGLLNLQGKLSLGTASGCGYVMAVLTGGTVNVGGTGSDRLSVCGSDIMKGNGACNSCGGTNSGQCAYNGNPYCEPAGGFTGPTGYGEGGYDATIPATVLPIDLAYFDIKLNRDQVDIVWGTEKEENFDHFEIQRAGKDLNFVSLISVPGATYNTSSLVRYTATDEAPLIGVNYYRLKAVDIDGSFEYFSIKSITYSGSKNFYISPNPTDGTTIKYRINFEPLPQDRVVLIDALGNPIMTQNVTGLENELIPVKMLAPGAYILQYISADYKKTARVFVKEN